MIHNIQNHFHLHNIIAMVLLDLEKAFDTVHHGALLLKLHKLNFPISTLKIIQSYLTYRSFRTKILNSYSTIKNIESSVPKDSKIGPILTSSQPTFLYLKTRKIYIYTLMTRLLPPHKDATTTPLTNYKKQLTRPLITTKPGD